MMKSIMLIDDDQLFNFLNKRIVQKMDLFEEVDVFNNAKSALEEIKTQHLLPQYILLDLRMPGMNGFEFLEAFEQLPQMLIQNIKVIVLTSSLLEEDHKKCMEYQKVVAFLPKPLDPERLKIYLV